FLTRMSRYSLGMTAGLLLSMATGCSLLLGIEPDCDQVSDCAPYTCDAENLACLSVCTADSECVSGYVCNTSNGVCEQAGCALEAEHRGLFSLQGDDLEFDAAQSGDGTWLLATSSQGVALILFDRDGNRVTSSENAVIGSAPAQPAYPVLVVNSAGVHAFWKSVTGDQRPQILHSVAAQESQASAPSAVYTGASGDTLDSLDAEVWGASIALVWSRFTNRSEVVGLELNADASYGEESAVSAPVDAPIVLTDDGVSSSLPAIASIGSRISLVRRDIRSGQNQIGLALFDPGFDRLVNQELSTLITTTITDVDVVAQGETNIAVWTDPSDGPARPTRALFSNAALLSAATPVAETESAATLISAVGRSGEYLVSWSEGDELDTEIRAVVLDGNGRPDGAVFSVASGERQVGDLTMLPTEVGYALYWVGGRAGQQEVFTARIACE
ncbi:MAG: hypothetical protein KC561_06510, partial [Myxococcales bacterium]|nr:hypothetical protein [Myxococcales bacterium]